jgi:diaminopimelate epimerase
VTAGGAEVGGVEGGGVGSGDALVEVAVGMGAAKVEGTLLVEIAGRTHAFTRVNVGNPHAITFEPYEEGAVDVVGPAVEKRPAGGTNVEFCRVVRGERPRDVRQSLPRIDVVVWERGVGRTQACGTGACAVAAAACAAGFFEYGKAVPVRLPGGELSIVIAAGSGEATMTGPARRAFSGEIALAKEPGRP